MREGVPWFVPPRWLDPDQVPRRDPVHRAVEEVRRAGHCLLAGRRG